MQGRRQGEGTGPQALHLPPVCRGPHPHPSEPRRRLTDNGLAICLRRGSEKDSPSCHQQVGENARRLQT